jgi:hypothetical protein
MPPGGAGIPKVGDDFSGQKVGVFLGLRLLTLRSGSSRQRKGFAPVERDHPGIGTVERLERLRRSAREGGEPQKVGGEKGKQARRGARSARRARSRLSFSSNRSSWAPG